MASGNDSVLKFNRPGVFKPSFTREALGRGAPVTRQSLQDFDDTNVLSSASFRYDPPGVGLKSTQQLRVDFSEFKNHTFFGSAEVYVNIAFENIFNRYPFDGSRLEIEAFQDGLTGFNNFVLESFPTNLGYLKFENDSFVEVIDHAGSQFPTISKTQTGRSALDPGLDSISFELQLHVPTVTNGNQVVLQKLSGSVHGFTLGLIGTGSTEVVDVLLSFVSASDAIALTGTIDKGGFTHLVGTYDRRQNVNKLFLYANEVLIASSSDQLDMGQLDFTLASMFIGSGSSAVTGSSTTFAPVETLSGAIDELRVFHDIRTVRQQQQFATKGIFAQPSLKLYFKFNEPTGTLGATVDDSLNRIVLDHSGNSLTSFIDSDTFSFDLRNTGSLASPMIFEERRFNPVLFSTFAPVVEFNQSLLVTASDYDEANLNIITNLVPRHYFLEGQGFEALENVTGTVADEVDGTGVPGEAVLGQPQLLAALLYTVAQELDEVKMFLDAFGKVLFVDYNDVDTTPDQLLTFLATYRGFELPGLFNNATFEQFVNAQDLDDGFSTSEKSLQQVQNEIWRRTLTNLNEIVKSKGTTHSIKAFIRTLGIDPDQNFRIREFGGPKQGRLGDSREDKSVVSTLIDMSGSNSATFLSSSFLTASARNEPGFPSVAGTSDDVLLTSGSWSVEEVVRFPLARTNVSSQSLARLCVTGAVSGGPDATLFNLVAASASFVASSSLTLFGHPASGSTNATLQLQLTGVNVMDGNQWNLSFGRNRNDDPIVELTSNVSSSYFLRAFRQSQGTIFEEHATASFFMEEATNDHTLDAQQSTASFLALGSQSLETGGGYLTGGARLVTALDGKVGHIRFWSKGLTEAESQEHALNFKSLGVQDPRFNFNFVTTLTGSFQRLRIDATTDQVVTQSDVNGSIQIFDFSQNGLHLTGSGFPLTSSIIQPETFHYSIISPKFDEATTNNKVRIRSFQDFANVQRFGGEVAPVYETPAPEEPEDDPRFTIDFSVSDALNEDIINIFATLDAMDDALGDAELMFSEDYPDLQGLREVYFNRLTDKVNLKSFFEFFRWFDTSVGMFIEQLIPRKTRFLGTNFVVESHMLERPKYQYKYEDVYIGENDRHGSKGTILLQLISGRVRRY